MYGPTQIAKRLLQGGAAFLLALFLCAPPVAMAAGLTAESGGEKRMLVPVGHTVGIKLFARGVVVVKLSEGGTPARECGLRTGDIIVSCGGTAVTLSLIHI